MSKSVIGSLASGQSFSEGQVTQNNDLTIDVKKFFYAGNANGKYSGSISQVVTDNLMNYVFLDSNYALAISSSYPSTEHVRLARVLAVSGTITQIIDERAFLKSMTSGSSHTHSNKTQLDLVTDGDHDILTGSVPHSLTKTQVGLGNVDDVAQIPLSQRGMASGIATLDSGTALPVSQLPTASISPTQVTTDQTDYAPTGFATTYFLRLTSDRIRSINSLAGGTDGRIVSIENVGTNPIVLTHESVSGAAANRFQCNGAVDFVIPASGSVNVRYDGVAFRWRPIAPFPGSLATDLNAMSASIISNLASLAYASGVASVSSWKNFVDAASTTDLNTYTGGGTGNLTSTTNVALIIDSRSMFAGESFFYGAHSTGSHIDFGLYDVLVAGSPVVPWNVVRRADFDSSADISAGANFRVRHGGLKYGNTGWTLVTTGSITLNTTALSFRPKSTRFVYQVITGSTAWNRPQGVSYFTAVGLRPGSAGGAGGGGGGSGFSGSFGRGAGGGCGGIGGGGASTEWFYGLTLTTQGSYTINIGAGGSAGVRGGGTGGGNGAAGGAGGAGGVTEILNPDGTILIRAGRGTPMTGASGSSGISGGGGVGNSSTGGFAGAPTGAGSINYGLMSTSGGVANTGGTGGNESGTNGSAGSFSPASLVVFVATESTKSGFIASGTSGAGGTGSGGTHGGGGGGGAGSPGGLGDEYSIFGTITGSGGMPGIGAPGGNGNSAGAGGFAAISGTAGTSGMGGRGGGGGGGAGGGGAGTTSTGMGGNGGAGGSGSIGQAILLWEIGV